jgi:hypothetical protein
VLYAFVRGAAKQYGSLWYGQVSVFNWFGYKVPGDPAPVADCTQQSDHSPTCGTSLNLMKRLMYTQLAYDSAYFAFEGGLTMATGPSTISPIGTLQAQAMQFHATHGGSGPSGLGVHVPTLGLLLDAMGGWVRPCDTRPQTYTAAAWGNVPWDSADFLADAVLDELFPGYRAGSLMRNETGTMAPTPYGDAVDVLLSDAILPVLQQYDTLVLAHRATTDSADVQRRLLAYAAGGGRLVLTASTLADLTALGGGFAGVSLLPCTPQPAGTVVKLAGSGEAVTEPLAFVACPLQATGPSQLLASFPGGQPAAVTVALGNGSVTVLGAGNYGMSTALTPGPLYGCAPDEPDSRTAQPYQLVQFVRALLSSALQAASTFDLGPDLAWVPKRVAQGTYVLTVTNPGLTQAALAITSRLGPVATVEELVLDVSEKGAVGYLPHGFEGVDVGNSTATTIAGGDTRLFRVTLASDASTVVPGGEGPSVPAPGPEWGWVGRRLLRLQAGGADIRRHVLARPGFLATFGGVVVDWRYLQARSAAARWLCPQSA